MLTPDEIKAKVLELKAQKDSVEGEKCEVYSRVVGYLRPTFLWNKGKKEELKLRKNYHIPGPK